MNENCDEEEKNLKKCFADIFLALKKNGGNKFFITKKISWKKKFCHEKKN